jgi:phage terminase large subunit-like protein
VRTTTRSPDKVDLPKRAELKRLRLSPEVAYYLISRKIPLPTCPPAIKTPEPGEVLRTARFDPARVDRVLKAFGLLRHTKGRWKGQALIPDPWQVAYVLAPVFGWVARDENGEWSRVVRELYVDVPRRNGKSTMCGGIAIYLTAADGEPGAEVVAAATTTNQAGFVFGPIKQLARSAPALRGHVQALQTRIVHPASGSYFAVISSTATAQHGANLHGAVIDELHAHKTPDLVDALETGTGSRRQPLIAKITTADEGKPNTVYARNRLYIEQLAKRVFIAPSTYGVVFAAAVDDDPFAEATQRAANPGFGISPTKASLKAAADKARQSPADLARYLRLHLGIRTRQQTVYLDLGAWDRNAGLVAETALAGREAYGGLDLASTSDLCALCWALPDEHGGYDALWRLWAPEAALEALDRRTAGSASVWARQGILTVTPGNVADYDYIKAAVLTDAQTFAVRDLAYDRWNATQLVNDLVAENVPMRPLGQGFASMSAPTKELQRLVLAGTAEAPKVRHGGNACVRWQIDNFAVQMDAAGNVKPAKHLAADKIDAVVALIMALDGASNQHEQRMTSAYEDRGLEVI